MVLSPKNLRAFYRNQKEKSGIKPLFKY